MCIKDIVLGMGGGKPQPHNTYNAPSPPSHQPQNTSFDPEGRVLTSVDGNGVQTSYTYSEPADCSPRWIIRIPLAWMPAISMIVMGV